jgi:hypothetical protein
MIVEQHDVVEQAGHGAGFLPGTLHPLIFQAIEEAVWRRDSSGSFDQIIYHTELRQLLLDDMAGILATAACWFG